jgi:hypothetical protein
VAYCKAFVVIQIFSILYWMLLDAVTSKISVATMLEMLKAESKKYRACVTTDSLTFVLSFMKVGQFF